MAKWPRNMVILFGGIAATTIGCAWCFGMQSVRISFAREQIDYFWSATVRAETALSESPPDARTAIACLTKIDEYYPSGTKQKVESKLDDIVECATMAKAKIVGDLRIVIGADLGSSPDEWIRRFDEFTPLGFNTEPRLEVERPVTPPVLGKAPK